MPTESRRRLSRREAIGLLGTGTGAGLVSLLATETSVTARCSAPGFLDSGLTVFASMLPRPARRSHVAPERGFDSGTSLASTARCTSA